MSNHHEQPCSSYDKAIAGALAWLRSRGVTSLEEAYQSRSGAFGMRTIDGFAGYRLELDHAHGAHINVWRGKEKGPHFTFPGSEADVRAKWRQLFLWDPNLKRRTLME